MTPARSTHKVFWQDPYLSRLETRIARTDGNDVTLDATVFYALSGGQEIVYSLAAGHGLQAGDAVVVVIDWDRRYRLMRLHFAAEIVLEVVYRELPSVRKIGAHIAADKARIDVEWPVSVAPLLPALYEQAMAIVRSDQPIQSAFSDEANDRRFWKIREFAEVPCGGTHLRRTGEVGAIALRRRNIGKGKERIEIALERSVTAP